ncbi:MAG: NUDIX hydrolase [Zhengella sp.]|uniref:NUDIX hydrolase n=1 Tax=Zhengella sp. TaxID=2282762 RepID=UPI001DD6422B|nr:NUDIX hydrolase [Notoacmeibacter sp.]MCC0028072.1 NUDIX hydrolase [Brucellaceae bacterium]
MDGMTRAEIDKAVNKDFALGKGPLRPRDAATLLLLDRSGPKPKVLLGKRHHKHAFMPGKFVFPGGRTDPADARIPTAADLPAAEAEKLNSLTRARFTPARARAIAMSAVRETYEEAGILIGHRQDFTTRAADWQGFSAHGVAPSLEGLRFVARAITPPGRVRRFDTRFFAVWRDSAALELPEGGPTQELEELMWLELADAMDADIPIITRTVIEELGKRLETDPELVPGGPVPFYRMIHNQFRRDVL